MKEALNGLIEHVSNSYLVQDTNLSVLSTQDGQCFVNIIQDFKFYLEWEHTTLHLNAQTR